MASTTKLKGRLVALLILAVVLALPVLWVVQRQAASEDGTPPPPPGTPSKSPTAGKPPRSKPSTQGVPEAAAPSQVPSTQEELLAYFRGEGKRSLAELHAAGTSSERRRELMAGLVSMPGMELDEIWNVIGTLPEGERSEWYTQLADRCAREQPAKFFQILGDMSPGSNRSSVIQSGVTALDFPNLQRMMDLVRKQGDEEEVADLAQNFHYVDNPALKSADLLGYARQLPPATEEELEARGDAPFELRDALAYGAGVLDANSGGKTDLDRLRRDFGDETANCYAEGLGKALMENAEEPERFTGFLAETTLSEETRHNLVQGFAAHSLQGGTTEAVALGDKLPAIDADTYYQELGRQLAARDSAEAARVLDRLPAGRARQVMAAQLAQHFESKGMPKEAERWKEER